MPLYEYKPTTDRGCAFCRDGFEVRQSVSVQPLTACPRCGAPVRKVPTSFSVGRDILSTSNLKDHGFTRLRKVDKGVYEKD